MTWGIALSIQEFILPHRVTMADLLRREDNGLTLVRILAASVVVLSHAVGLQGGPEAMDWAQQHTPFSVAAHAVNVFFVLSGLLVSASFERSASAADYFGKRIARIVPGLLVASLLVAFVIGPMVTASPLETYFGSWRSWAYPVLAGLFLRAPASLPGVFEAAPVAGLVNEPIWTLKYEVLCYVLLPALVAAGVLRSRLVMVGVLVGALALYAGTTAHVEPHGMWTIPAHLGRFIPAFVLGVAAYAMRDRVVLSPAAAALAIVAAVALNGTPLAILAWIVACGYGALVLADRLSRGTGAAMGRWTRQHDVSYGVYIYGWPIGQALVVSIPGLSLPALALLSLGLAMAAGALSWHGVEVPMSRLFAGPPGRPRVARAWR
jgi:peptidoglycan/LPS O-acetylase OafA/YrhL